MNRANNILIVYFTDAESESDSINLYKKFNDVINDDVIKQKRKEGWEKGGQE